MKALVRSSSAIPGHEGLGLSRIALLLCSLFVGLLVAAWPSSAQAEEVAAPCTDPSELAGFVYSASEESLIVSYGFMSEFRRQIEFPASTVVLGPNGEPTDRSRVRPGASVSVRFCWGDFEALVVHITRDAPITNECAQVSEIWGELEQLAPNSDLIKVNGQQARITTSTIFHDQQGQPIGMMDFDLGDRVMAHLCHDSNVTPRVLKLQQLPNPERVEIQGFVTNVTNVRNLGTVFTVEGVNWQVLPATILRDQFTRPVTPSAIQVGMFVKVKGLPPLPGVLEHRAEIVELRVPSPNVDRPELQVVGPILRINHQNRTFHVQGFEVLVTNTTTFSLRTRTGELFESSFDELALGQVVHVRGVAPPQIAIFPPPPPAIEARAVIATEHFAPPPPETEREFALRGVLQRVSEDGTLFLLNGAIQTTEATAFQDGGTLEEIALTDLIPGDFLIIEGTVSNTGRRVADLVVRTAPVGRPIVHFGPVEIVGERGIVVAGRAFLLTEETVIVGLFDEIWPPEILIVGTLVEVVATELPGQAPVAERIRVRQGPRPTCSADVEFRGVIRSIEPDALTVGERHVTFGNTTEIRFESGRPAPVTALLPGVAVHVAGQSAISLGAIDTGVAACEIVIVGSPTTPPPTVAQILGPVTAIDPEASTITVNRVVVLVGENTRILPRVPADVVLTLEDMKLGDVVLARGTRLDDGRFEAQVIVIQEDRLPPPPPAIAVQRAGIVMALFPPFGFATPEFTVNYQTEPATRFVGLDGEEISADNIQIGDKIVVRGRFVDPEDRQTITAREVAVRPALITAIDARNQTFSINGVRVASSEATTYGAMQGTRPAPIGFEDLRVGDLVRVAAEFSEEEAGVLVASSVLRLRTFNVITEPTDEFVPPRIGHDRGRPVIEVENNENTFGFISLPEEAFAVEPDTLYEVTARVETNVTNRNQVPTVRLRSNNSDFQRGSEFVVESTAEARFVPTPEGRVLRSYFVPAQSAGTTISRLRTWFASLDVINFARINAAVARFVLDDIQVRAIPLSQVRVAEILVDESFEDGAAGWEFGGLRDRYNVPVSNRGVAGSLDMAPTQIRTVGWWSGDTGVTVEGGALYRGRFLVRSGATDANRVPTFRVRLNLRSFQLASVLVITSTGDGPDSPTRQGRLYDVYLYVPEGIGDNEGIRASIDLVHMEEENELVPISLEHFTLERLEIDGD